MNKHDHWPEPMSGPLPECFASYEEALATYMEERENGFDGNYNDFLDMSRRAIDRGYAERAFRKAGSELLELDRPALRRLSAEFLDKAS
jgi:hypothetical protein